MPFGSFRRRGAVRPSVAAALRVPPAFDIPVGIDPNRSDDPTGLSGAAVGARWESDTIVTAIVVGPARPVARRHCIGRPAAALGAETSIDLAVLHGFRRSARATVTLDLSVTEHRYCGAGPVAAAYRSTLGSLPVAASRRTVVVLRLPVAQFGTPARGSAVTHVLRTAATVTRRLAALLAARGLRPSICTADGLRAHTEHLLGPGLLAPGIEESAAGFGVTVEPTRVSAGRASWRTFALRPSTPSTALAALAGEHAVSTTTLLRLSGHRETPTLHGLIGVAEVPGAGRCLRTGPIDLDPLDGDQLSALADRLPAVGPRRLPLAALPATPEALRRWRFGLGDDGLLIGADGQGHAVTAPLLSSARHPAELIGDPALIALLLQRSIGGGAAISIHTAAPHRWTRLLDAVDDCGVLALGSTAPAAGTLVDVDVYDDSTGDDTLRLRLARRGDADDASAWMRVAGSPADPARVELTVGDQHVALTGVATPAERTLVGAL